MIEMFISLWSGHVHITCDWTRVRKSDWSQLSYGHFNRVLLRFPLKTGNRIFLTFRPMAKGNNFWISL